MGLSMSMDLGMSITNRLELRQSMEAKMELLQTGLLSLRKEFDYIPKGKCPKCGKKLSAQEIVDGFSLDVTDFRTRCPKCGTRFLCTLQNGYDVEVRFKCPDQTLFELKEYADQTPVWIMLGVPDLYRSAYYHFGSLKNAFEKLEVKYEFENEDDIWISRIKDYLGLFSDVKIAEAVKQPVSKIRKLRKSLRIPKASKKNIERYFGL